MGAVVVADDGLGTHCNAHQNRDQDLVDLHDNAGGGERNFRAVDRLGAVGGQQVVGEGHDNGDGELGDEAADAKAGNPDAGPGLQPEGTEVKAEGFELGQVDPPKKQRMPPGP